PIPWNGQQALLLSLIILSACRTIPHDTRCGVNLICKHRLQKAVIHFPRSIMEDVRLGGQIPLPARSAKSSICPVIPGCLLLQLWSCQYCALAFYFELMT